MVKLLLILKWERNQLRLLGCLGRHRSTICREIKRGSVNQVQDKNGKRTYFSTYFADSGQRVYETNRQKCSYLKLNDCSARFIEQLGDALKANVRLHSVDSFVQTYKATHPEEVVPSTKTIYRYIKEGLLAIKPIDLPKMVSIRKRSKKVTKTNRKTLGKSIEERPECINDRSEFGHWEIDLILGKKTKGEAVILTLVERQTRYALGVKLEDKQSHTTNSAVRHLTNLYPIVSIPADNGSEFSLLSDLEAVDVYFAHPYSSHERGTNENFNGLLREYVPKGVSLNSLTTEELDNYITAFNERPRRLLQYQSSKFLFGLAQTS